MSKLSKQAFFHGVMLWGENRSGISFQNRRISDRVDSENMDAFLFAFHESKDVLQLLAHEFEKLGISCEIVPLDKYTAGRQGYVLETQRHPDFTEEHQFWYKDNGGMN